MFEMNECKGKFGNTRDQDSGLYSFQLNQNLIFEEL